MFKKIKDRWSSRHGYKEILIVAVPLILSTGSWSIQNFVDRMFLTWYSPEAIAAAMPAGLLNFTFMSFFIGTAGYVTTFVAHYKGAGRPERIGSVIWQGVYLSVAGGILIMLTMPFSDLFFSSIGHPVKIAENESIFYFWLCFGAIPAITASSLSGFYSGLGKTMPVMWINIGATVITVGLDYLLIFGNFGFPRMGMRGAAIATGLSQVFSCCTYGFLIFSKKNNELYRTISGWRIDSLLIKRIIRFGAPSGAQFFLDVAGFAAFIIFVGALGDVPLAASNIAFSINTLAFMPMIGIGIAVSIFVGQNMGGKNISGAKKSVWSGFHIAFTYMCLIAAAYLFYPHLFLDPFLSGGRYSHTGEIMNVAIVLLRFVAVYTIFDSLNMIFGSALKGAGDTKFVMLSNIGLTLFVLVIPSFVLIRFAHANIFGAWYVAALYIVILGLCFLIRFLTGKWTLMRVIEEVQVPVSGRCRPEVPTVE